MPREISEDLAATIQATAQAAHRAVWTWRKANEWYFQTPPPKRALGFAATEAGEAAQVVMYQISQAEGYKRNRDRSHMELWAELADCFIMLATALPNPNWNDTAWLINVLDVEDTSDMEAVIADLMEDIGRSWNWLKKGWGLWETRATLALRKITLAFIDHQQPLVAVVGKRLQRWEFNHNPDPAFVEWRAQRAIEANW